MAELDQASHFPLTAVGGTGADVAVERARHVRRRSRGPKRRKWRDPPCTAPGLPLAGAARTSVPRSAALGPQCGRCVSRDSGDVDDDLRWLAQREEPTGAESSRPEGRQTKPTAVKTTSEAGEVGDRLGRRRLRRRPAARAWNGSGCRP